MTPEARTQLLQALNQSSGGARVVWAGVVDHVGTPLVHAFIDAPRLTQVGSVNPPGFEVLYYDVGQLAYVAQRPGRIAEVLDDGLYEGSHLMGEDVAGHLSRAIRNIDDLTGVMAGAVLQDAPVLGRNNQERRLLAREILLVLYVEANGALPNGERWRAAMQTPSAETQDLVRICAGEIDDRTAEVVLQRHLVQMRRMANEDPRLPMAAVADVAFQLRGLATAIGQRQVEPRPAIEVGAPQVRPQPPTPPPVHRVAIEVPYKPQAAPVAAPQVAPPRAQPAPAAPAAPRAPARGEGEDGNQKKAAAKKKTKTMRTGVGDFRL